MKELLPKPNPRALIYHDKKLYICLASFPIAEGHTVVVWKDKISDLHLLAKKEYEYLMDRVDEVRNAMIKTLRVKKIYLLYMDETNHVHWHLIPRYNIKGFNMLKHYPSRLKDFSLALKIKKNLAALK